MKNQPKTIKVNPSDYEVYAFASGYFGICEKGSHAAVCVAGGDSANEDDYNEEYMNEILAEWDGTLHFSETYGYTIAD